MRFMWRSAALAVLTVCLPFAVRAQSAPKLNNTPPDQQVTLKGTGQTKVAGYTAITVQLCVSDTKPATPTVDCTTHATLDPDAPVTVAADGSFTATLKTVLKTGQYVYAVQTTTGTVTTALGTPVQVVAIAAPAFDSNLTAPIAKATGTGQAPSTDLYTSVEIYVCHSTDSSNAGKDCSAAASPLQAAIDPSVAGGSTSFVLVGANGQWVANLKTALPLNETVWLWEIARTATGTATNASGAGAASQPVRPTIDPTTLKGGGGVVTGTATASAASGAKVMVQLCRKAPGSDTCVVFGNSAEVGTDGNYSLQHAMTEGEVLTVQQRSVNPSTPIKSGYQESEAVMVGVPDNERVSIDFIGGILLSQQQQSFSQANLFLGLNMDLDFYRPGYYSQFEYACNLQKGKVKRAGSKAADRLCVKTHHPGLNGFFQARLSAIPVNSTQTTATTTTGTTTDAYETFLVSRKSSHFEMGLYLPTYFGNTHLPTSALRQDFFVAPIARFGFNTLVADDSGSNTNTAAAGGAATVVTSTKPVGVADPNTSVYSFGVVGFRVGAADMKAGSPHIAHYLDLGVGKFSNLRNLYCSTKSSCLTNAMIDPTKQSYYTPYRFLVEGAIELDGFLLGFSINKGQNFSGFHRPSDVSPANPQITQAADDVRFLLGYKFDVRKLLDAVKKSSNF